jgi:hypothetical protein
MLKCGNFGSINVTLNDGAFMFLVRRDNSRRQELAVVEEGNPTPLVGGNDVPEACTASIGQAKTDRGRADFIFGERYGREISLVQKCPSLQAEGHLVRITL